MLRCMNGLQSSTTDPELVELWNEVCAQSRKTEEYCDSVTDKTREFVSAAHEAVTQNGSEKGDTKLFLAMFIKNNTAEMGKLDRLEEAAQLAVHRTAGSHGLLHLVGSWEHDNCDALEQPPISEDLTVALDDCPDTVAVDDTCEELAVCIRVFIFA